MCGLVSLLLCVEEYRLATNSHKRIQIKYEWELPAAKNTGSPQMNTDLHRLIQVGHELHEFTQKNKLNTNEDCLRQKIQVRHR